MNKSVDELAREFAETTVHKHVAGMYFKAGHASRDSEVADLNASVDGTSRLLTKACDSILNLQAQVVLLEEVCGLECDCDSPMHDICERCEALEKLAELRKKK